MRMAVKKQSTIQMKFMNVLGELMVELLESF